jgi:DNA-binding LacI/PurR family transcriptional regulator
VEYAASTSEAFSLCKRAIAQNKYDAIFCMNDALILGAWQALQATPSPIDLFGMSETGMPSLLPPTISYAYYSGEAAATETIGLMLKIMREKTPATENSRSISWQERKA